MSRYESITKDMHVVDVTPSAIDGYLYYGYVDKTGKWAILREKSDGTEYRWAIGGSGYSTAWTNKATQGYGYGILS